MTNELAVPQTSVTPMQMKEDVQNAHEKAMILHDIIQQQNLYTQIGNSQHLRVEGWQVIAKGYGLSLDIEWSRPLPGGGFEARAVARDLQQMKNCLDQGMDIEAARAASEIQAGDAECGSPGDDNWVNKPHFQQRSMAQTRATGKAAKLCLGWVVTLAGYSATPAEEMVREQPAPRREQQQPRQQPAPRQQPPQQPPQQAVVIEQDETEYGVCPMHNEPWRGSPPEITEKYGLLLSHSQQGGGYCKFGVIYKDIFISSFAGAFGSYTDPAGIQWLKDNYGNRTWSKLEWIEQLQAVEELQEQSLAAIRPEATQRLSVIEAEEDGDGDSDVIWEVTV